MHIFGREIGGRRSNMTRVYQKKVKLAVHGRRVKWAPVWIVLKKYGKGKKIHPSSMTRLKRSWRYSNPNWCGKRLNGANRYSSREPKARSCISLPGAARV